MNIDPFASSAFSLILAWIFAIPILLGTLIIPFKVFGKEFKGDRILFIWFGICLLLLSPVRYLLFQGILLSSYIFQSWGAFISAFLLVIYVPAVFCILYFIGVGLPFLTVSFIIGKTYHISFNKGIITAIVFPIICLISTYLFYLILPYAAWTVHWVNPKDVIKATNGPAAIVYKYVTSPFSFSPAMVNGIFDRTPKRDIDSLRCHVATTYMKNQKFWYFVKLQYPAIFQQIEAIELNPKDARVYFSRGVAKFNSKDYLGAIKDFNKAIELNPKDAEAYFSRGMAKISLKENLGAIKDFNNAIKLNPKYEAYVLRGIAKVNIKDNLGAIQDYNKAIELNPKYAKAYLERGRTKIFLKDCRGAIQDYNKAIKLNPKYAKAYFGRGVAKFILKNYQGAIKDFNKAIELNPKDAEAYFSRGMAKIELKDKYGGCLDISKAGELGYKKAYDAIQKYCQ